MKRKLRTPINQEKIELFCKKWHIKTLALFGSVLTDDFNRKSDVDFLAQFKRNHIPTFFDIFDMKEELRKIVKRKADLCTPKGLSRFFRDRVLAEALQIYGQ